MTPKNSPLPACPDFLADFSDFVDGRLTPAHRSELQAHLDCCEACLRHLAAYRRGVAAYRARTEIGADPERFWERLERRLWIEGHLGPRERVEREEGWSRHPAVAIGAAALFALVVFWAGMWSYARWPGVGPDASMSTPRVVSVTGSPAAPGGNVRWSGAAVSDPAVKPSAPRRTAPATRTGAPIVLASVEGATIERRRAAEPLPLDAIGAEAGEAPWLEREFRRLEERIEVGEHGPPSTWSHGWIDPLEVRPIRIRTAGAAQVPIQVWPVEAAISIP